MSFKKYVYNIQINFYYWTLSALDEIIRAQILISLCIKGFWLFRIIFLIKILYTTQNKQTNKHLAGNLMLKLQISRKNIQSLQLLFDICESSTSQSQPGSNLQFDTIIFIDLQAKEHTPEELQITFFTGWRVSSLVRFGFLLKDFVEALNSELGDVYAAGLGRAGIN